MIVRISDLSMQYSRGAIPALQNVNLTIPHGAFGLLGPNGAGKTTLIKILSTQMEATEGRVTMDDWDLRADRTEIRARLGYLPQHFGPYPQLTAWEFLDYMALLGGLHDRKARLDRVSRALNDVGLYEARNRRSGAFSGGMTRRLGIAQAILTDPEFLIVDEPTVGLDPEERIRFRGILGRLSRDRAILISTHIVGDISSTCEDLAILRAGEVVYRGTPASLIAQAEGKVWEISIADRDFEALAVRFHVVTVHTEGERMRLRMVGVASPPEKARVVAPTLEDAYVLFMGGVPEDAEDIL